jgi:endonuclease/exonuclease/phosphatase family metal-dependent hydrolase
VQLRVVTYNVKAFRLGLERTVEVVRSLEPDIVLLQESGGRRELRRFTADLEMQVARDPWSPLGRRVKNAVLVRPPWRIVRHHLHRMRGTERFHPRGALVAQVGRAGRRLWAVSSHLGLAPVERREHAKELTSLLEELEGEVLLGIDVNETPDRRAAAWFSSRLWDVWERAGSGDGATFPSPDPTSRIDFLFVSGGVGVDRAGVAPDPSAASDHRAVIAELTVE